MNAKNLALSPAASDLGLGDMLGMQVQDETDDARKKRQQQMSDRGIAQAARDLLGGGLGDYGV